MRTPKENQRRQLAAHSPVLSLHGFEHETQILPVGEIGAHTAH